MGGVGTSDEQNGTQAAGEGLSMAGDGDQGEEEQRKSMPKWHQDLYCRSRTIR